MGQFYSEWIAQSEKTPQTFDEVKKAIQENRAFSPVTSLDYGDYGLEDAFSAMTDAIDSGKKIALYADYDVDGTMSCVSWIWFLKALGYSNFVYYIPDRFKEGYGVNLDAVKHLRSDHGAEVIITMDTGITANEEAKWCKENGVEFICTDHHKIQPDIMPDCIILNPKQHPDPQYQELCGCGITFVLIRKLGRHYGLEGDVWTDILALTGMATICDIVPLNGVNHKLAKMGVAALTRSKRPVLKRLLEAVSVMEKADEMDVGFRLGPRINAVGRLEHAHKVIEAFVSEDPEHLIEFMGTCNERRKAIQNAIIEKAVAASADFKDDPILFLGDEDWHQGVVGIAASKLVELNWKPVWLFQRGKMCKGSARSIEGFDVTDAMTAAKHAFHKFGGHKAAGGFSFEGENESAVREALVAYAHGLKQTHPELWVSKKTYDFELPTSLLDLQLVECLDELKPFGHKFENPVFKITAVVEDVVFYNDKTTGNPKHTAVQIETPQFGRQKVMFFSHVLEEIDKGSEYSFLVTASKNHFRGNVYLSLFGEDIELKPQ